MDRPRAAALFRGDRDLADVLPAADDLGGCGRSRLRRTRGRRGLRGDRNGYWRRRKAAARAWPRKLIAQHGPRDCAVWASITFARLDANAIDLPSGYGDIHAFASTLRCKFHHSGTRHDRPSLLDHAERPQDHDVS